MHLLMQKFGRFLAIISGLVISILVTITTVSIIGRTLNSVMHGWIGDLMPKVSQFFLEKGIGPILGDFEIVEAGMAFAIFASIPVCQITAGHASVDIFANSLAPTLQRFLRMVVEILFAAVLILVAWRLYEGMLSKKAYSETTFLLQFPIWWAYAASFVAALAGAICGIYMACVRIIEFRCGHSIVNQEVDGEI